MLQKIVSNQRLVAPSIKFHPNVVYFISA